jgi:site-specific DNA-cytosine methylase
MPTIGSLFSGAGLGDLGLEWAGFEHKFFGNYILKSLD